MALKSKKSVQRVILFPVGVGNIPLRDIKRAVANVANVRRRQEAAAASKNTNRPTKAKA